MSFDLKVHRGKLVIEGGTIKTVFDNEKLIQDIIKIMLTKSGTNKYHPGYGSLVGALQIGHIFDENLLVGDLRSSAEQAIRKVMSIQRNQSRRQFLSPGEVILNIKRIDVERNIQDPRFFTIFISVLTQKLTLVTESISIRVV